MTCLLNRFMDWAGIGDIERRHREWRRQQISLEIEEAQAECAELGAYIGRLKKEQAELSQPIQENP